MKPNLTGLSQNLLGRRPEGTGPKTQSFRWAERLTGTFFLLQVLHIFSSYKYKKQSRTRGPRVGNISNTFVSYHFSILHFLVLLWEKQCLPPDSFFSPLYPSFLFVDLGLFQLISFILRPYPSHLLFCLVRILSGLSLLDWINFLYFLFFRLIFCAINRRRNHYCLRER